MKKCIDCNKEKELSEFYKHKKMMDGHLNKCKACVKLRVSKHRDENIDRIREYDRNRPNHIERGEAHKERVSKLKLDNPRKYTEYKKSVSEWAKKNKHKRNAQNRVAKALYSGKIKRPSTCEHCPESENLHAHHPDYNKPLEVIWLCPSCHGKEHKRLNEIKRNSSI